MFMMNEDYNENSRDDLPAFDNPVTAAPPPPRPAAPAAPAPEPPTPRQTPPADPDAPNVRTEEGVLLALEVAPCLDRCGNEARRTVFSFESDPGRRFSASFGNDFDEEDIPRGSLIHITYVEKPGVSKYTGKPVVWRNLVAPPIVLRRGMCDEDDDPLDEYPGLDAGVAPGQRGAGGGIDRFAIAGRLLTNVARARKKLRSLSRLGPLPREVAASIAEAVSALGRDVRSELTRSL